MQFGKATLTALLLLYNSNNVQGKPSKPSKPPKDDNDNDSMGPEQIGSHHAVRISSDDAASDIQPVMSSNSKRQVYSLKHEGASYISVHFANMNLPPSCSMEITDA